MSSAMLREPPVFARMLSAAIQDNAAERPDAPAILCPGRLTLDYAGLDRAVRRIGDLLRSAGIQQRSVVGLAMPHGPELALATAAVASHAVVLPLNPAATEEELDSLFSRSHLTALIVSGDARSPARVAAERHGAGILQTAPCDRQAIDLRLNIVRAAPRQEPVVPPDSTLIFQTSGTTERPKLVPITHTNLFAAAAMMRHWYGLTPTDRSLAAAPLHYGYGVRIQLLVPLVAGVGIVCLESREPEHLFNCLAEQAPTWYGGTPALHRAILDLARSRTAPDHALRFILSGGTALSEDVRSGLEETLGVPVLEYYGLSEAGQMASNPAPPARRKAGTVGMPWPGELRIMRDDGSAAAKGEIGEIAVRGPGVMPGYLDDPSPFTGEWFRTGDLGQIDDEGFLALSGRVKEMINRGGEKVAPLEIDNALVAHPAVKEAAAFAVPHPRLGQNVAAAVVLKEAASVEPQELRRFLRTKLAPAKVPHRIFVVSEMPRGQAGKVKRDALTAVFAHSADSKQARTPLSAFEVMLGDIWKRLLERGDIGVDDDFFEKGGDSLLAVRMLLEAEAAFDVKLPDDVLFEASTIRQILKYVDEGRPAEQKPIIQLQEGSETPVFFFHGDFAGGGLYARKIAPALGKDRPFYLVATHGTRGDPVPETIEEMAADRLESIRQIRPHGPYVVAGYCHGAHVALETARRLMEAEEPVEAVLMIEPLSLNAWSAARLAGRLLGLATGALSRSAAAQKRAHREAMHAVWTALLRIDAHVAKWQRFLLMPAPARTNKVADKLRRRAAALSGRGDPRARHSPAPIPGSPLAEFWDSELWRTVGYVTPTYIPRLPPTRVICYVGKETRGFKFSTRPWSRLGAVEIVAVAGDHATSVTTHVAGLADSMRQDLSRGDRLPAGDRRRKPSTSALTGAQ